MPGRYVRTHGMSKMSTWFPKTKYSRIIFR